MKNSNIVQKNNSHLQVAAISELTSVLLSFAEDKISFELQVSVLNLSHLNECVKF